MYYTTPGPFFYGLVRVETRLERACERMPGVASGAATYRTKLLSASARDSKPVRGQPIILISTQTDGKRIQELCLGGEGGGGGGGGGTFFC